MRCPGISFHHLLVWLLALCRRLLLVVRWMVSPLTNGQAYVQTECDTLASLGNGPVIDWVLWHSDLRVGGSVGGVYHLHHR